MADRELEQIRIDCPRCDVKPFDKRSEASDAHLPMTHYAALCRPCNRHKDKPRG